MDGIQYIVKKRMKAEGLDGYFNLPYGTTGEAVGEIIYCEGKAVCAVKSRKAHLFFARNDDGKGRERGALTLAITKRLEKRDKDHQGRWDRVWEDPVCQKYRHQEHEDHFIWGHAFFEAPVEDLRHIAALVGARGWQRGQCEGDRGTVRRH